MIIREATIDDIKQIQVVRNAVKENRLSDPSRVTDSDCEKFLTVKGKGWVADMDGKVIGFSIVDLADKNIWALFVDPLFEGQGVGRQLHDIMLDCYFKNSEETVWLSTSPGTRAESFYNKAGWIKTGMYGEGEIKFEMSHLQWKQQATAALNK